MFTFMFGLRFTLKPFWPWRPGFTGWLSLLWVHLLFTAKRSPRLVAGEIAKPLTRSETELLGHMVKDPSKRRTLSPGVQESLVKSGIISTAAESAKPKTIYEAIAEAKAAKAAAAQSVTAAIPNTDIAAPQGHLTATQERIITPMGGERAQVAANAVHYGAALQYEFHGSQLTVGAITLARNLGSGKHRMEITAGNQLYIDTNLMTVAPSDLQRVKDELLKLKA